MNAQEILDNVRHILESNGEIKKCAITYETDISVCIGINDALILPVLEDIAKKVNDPYLMVDGGDGQGFLFQLWIDK